MKNWISSASEWMQRGAMGLGFTLVLLGTSTGAAMAQGASPESVKATEAPAAPAAVVPAIKTDTPLLPSSVTLTPAAQAQVERQAVQPGNNAPTWREVNSGKEHYTSIPGGERGVLIQSNGQTWRLIRNGQISLYGGIVLAAVASIIMLTFWVKGPILLPEPRTGRLIERFTSAERMAHWSVAISFIALAITGLVLIFGKYVLLPIFGYTLFAWLAILCKNVHNFVGPLFGASLVVFFIMYVKDNFPNASDIKWLLKGGGLFSDGHVPSGRFNMGEKLWFWGGLTFLGIVVTASGMVLNFPNFEQSRFIMQQANIIHGVATLIFITMSLGHIYIGSIGMEGALEGMRYGFVDETWAKAHHEDWYNDIVEGRVPAVRTPEGANTLGSQAFKPARA
jgi:formate dehydrogenase subunit gamma